jgi:endogenous inhibitor of DNA gyrase (YacG/DUF329 family)
MIPFSVSDILKILNDIPIWKAVAGLPRRVAELERAVCELQEKSASISARKAPMGRECPICGATMKVLSEVEHPRFGFAGRKVHNMECPECGNKTSRDFEPGKGYR